MSELIATEHTTYDLPALVDQLNRLLRLRTTPIGMKLFERQLASARQPGHKRQAQSEFAQRSPPRASLKAALLEIPRPCLSRGGPHGCIPGGCTRM